MGRKRKTNSSVVRVQDRGPDEHGFFEIEKILQKWVDKQTGEVQYLVKWLGYPKSYNSWEPLSIFDTCIDIVKEYEDKRERERLRKRSKKGTVQETLEDSHKMEGTLENFTLNENDSVAENYKKNNLSVGEFEVVHEESLTLDDSDKKYRSPIIPSGKTLQERRNEVPTFIEPMEIDNSIFYVIKWPSDNCYYCLASPLAKEFYPMTLVNFFHEETLKKFREQGRSAQ